MEIVIKAHEINAGDELAVVKRPQPERVFLPIRKVVYEKGDTVVVLVGDGWSTMRNADDYLRIERAVPLRVAS